MSAYETIPCTECGEPTIAARPVCSLCEADKGLFAPRAEAVPPDPEFARWWMAPDPRTGHAPSASLDLGSAQKTWAAARAIPAGAPAAACPMQAFLEKLDSSDPAVRVDAEAHAQRVADELSRTMPAASAPAPATEPIRVPGGQFEEVGAVYRERVNQDYHATLNDDLVVDGEKLYRFVAHPRCSSCHSEGFAPSVTGAGCTFCDGTEGGATPEPAGLGQPGDGLDADDITNLRDALTWMGEATYESHEECGIYRYRLIRRLIAANLFARDYAYAKSTEGHTPASPVKDHDIREAVNQLREVAVRFHHTQQLRSRIQDIVLPLMARATATRNN